MISPQVTFEFQQSSRDSFFIVTSYSLTSAEQIFAIPKQEGGFSDQTAGLGNSLVDLDLDLSSHRRASLVMSLCLLL